MHSLGHDAIRVFQLETKTAHYWLAKLNRTTDEVFNQPQPTVALSFDDGEALEELSFITGRITVDEIKAALQSLQNKKAPVLDEISLEMLKAEDHWY
ncbi:unnamed protein product [Nippostrongylus brasiliensis]|uniref:DNA mismatch repair protein MutS n=1 Tax=Nippostrongylus brasiliensis TaxID=27835 RepID=A0A0N4XXK5_NIPBR|nr:unnamed protein product [Nippostrongylus brasiliensis]